MLVVVLCGSSWSIKAVEAQSSELSSGDLDRIAALSKAVLSCQLSDGAIPVVRYREAGRPAYIDAYFSHLACLGLLASPPQTTDREQVHAYVERWLNWCIEHQEEDGTFNRFAGVIDNYGKLSNNPQVISPDSLDSYAALFLAVASQYTASTQDEPSSELIKACKKSCEVLERCRDIQTGFYWNFPDIEASKGVVPAQYLLDNVEVYQGLHACVSFFHAAGDEKQADIVRHRASDLASRLHAFWAPSDKYFVCMYGDKLARVGWGQQIATAERLSTVSALAFFHHVKQKTREELWSKFWQSHGSTVENYLSTAQFSAEEPTLERVYLASLKSGSQSQKHQILVALRSRTDELLRRHDQLADPASVSLSYPYVHRYGMSIQALLAQHDPWPSGLPQVPLDESQAP